MQFFLKSVIAADTASMKSVLCANKIMIAALVFGSWINISFLIRLNDKACAVRLRRCGILRWIHPASVASGKRYAEHAGHEFVKIVEGRDDQGIGGDGAHHNSGRHDDILHHALSVLVSVCTPYKIDHRLLNIPLIIPRYSSSATGSIAKRAQINVFLTTLCFIITFITLFCTDFSAKLPADCRHS